MKLFDTFIISIYLNGQNKLIQNIEKYNQFKMSRK